MPLDALTASRLARDGEKAGPVRHMCSGQHTVSLLLSRLRGWDPSRVLEARRIRRRSPTGRPSLPSSTRRRRTSALRVDGCGIETFAFPLREIARAFAMLADPASIPANDPRAALAPALTIVRDAMLANPELIGGRHDRLDTSMMKAAPGRLISKSGMEALRGVAILPGPRIGTQSTAASGPGPQDRGRRRLRSRHLGSVGRGAPPGRGARRWRAARPGPLSPAGQPGPARTRRRRGGRRLRARAGGRADRLTAGAMAFDADPYRTLGLARGASLDEVKRAYRRLAKANHPDAAGSGALARFLAIQAAYEQLVEGPARAAGRPSGPSSAARPGTARRTSEADPDRADATRRAYGGRARARRPADGPPGREPARRGRRFRRATLVRSRTRGPRGPPKRTGTGRFGAAPRQGDARLDLLRRRDRGLRRAGLERRELVRDDQRDVLDDQPEGVRGPAQARPRIPGAGQAGVGARPEPGPTRGPRAGRRALLGAARPSRGRSARPDTARSPTARRVECSPTDRSSGVDGSPIRAGPVRRAVAASPTTQVAGSGPGPGQPGPGADRPADRRPARPGRSGRSSAGCPSPWASAGCSARSPAAAASPRPATRRSTR